MKKIDASLYNTPIRFYNYAKLMFSENSDGVYVTFKTLRELNSIIGYINKERDKQLDIEEGFVSDKYSVIWKRKLFSLTCGEIKTIKYDSYPIDICFGSIEQLHKFAEEFTKSPMSQETVLLDKSKGKGFTMPKDKNTKNALSKETQKFQLKVFFVGLSVCLVGLFVYMLFDNSGSDGASSSYGFENRSSFVYTDAIGKEYQIVCNSDGTAYVKMLSAPKNELEEYAYAAERKGSRGSWEKKYYFVGDNRKIDYIEVLLPNYNYLYISDGYVYQSFSDMKTKYNGFRCR